MFSKLWSVPQLHYFAARSTAGGEIIYAIATGYSTPCRLSALRIKMSQNPLPKYLRSPLGYSKVCKKSSGRTSMMKYLNTFNHFHNAHACPIQKNPHTQAGIWVPAPWNREPTGRRRPSGPRTGLKRVPGGRYPCPGDSVGTGLSGFDQGFAGSWVYPLRPYKTWRR